MSTYQRGQLNHRGLDLPLLFALRLQSWRTRLAIVGGATILYVLLFVAGFALFGAGEAAVALLPVVVAGWLLGRRAGFAAGLASILVNTPLLHLVGIPGWDALVRVGGGPGTVLLIVMGWCAGGLGELLAAWRTRSRILACEQEQLAADMAARLQMETTLQRQNGYLTALHETALALVKRLDLADLLEPIVARATTLVGTPHGYLYLVEPATNTLTLKVGTGAFQQYVGHTLARGEGLAGKVWQTGQPLVVSDYADWPGRVTFVDRSQFQVITGVPLTAESQVVGVLGLAHRDGGRTFTDEDLTLLQRFAQLASIALENARLFTAAQRELTERQRAEAALRASEHQYRELFVAARRQAQELALLDQVRTALTREVDLPNLFRTVVEAIAATFGYTQVSLYLCRNDVLVLQHQVGYDQLITHIPITQGVSGRVVRTATPVLLEDVRMDATFLGAIDGIVSEICVPLIAQDQIVGILNVESTRGVRLGPADLQLILAVSMQVNIAIGRARLYMRVHESEARYRSVIAALSEGIVVLDADGHIRTCNASAEQILGIPAAQLLQRTSFDLVWAAIHEDGSPFPAETHPAMVTLRTGVPQTNVIMGVHKPDGTLTWIAINTQPLGEPDATQPSAVVASFADITERKQLEEVLWTQALRDPLTGLFNRRYLAEALERELAYAEATETSVGVMMVDLDHFKQFNDTYGHAAGDALLGEVGQFLQTQVRKEDTVCRYGGEEFTVILRGASLEDTRWRAEQVRAGVKQVQVAYEGQILDPVSLSVGVAVYPDHGISSTILVQLADTALYQAKVSGRDRVVVAGTIL
jgi:diguanylate cyclase (GGDEF)-like protein/PAS domain S-box-containing protein